MSLPIPFASDWVSLRTDRVSAEDAERQERTAAEILKRLEQQPGLILADEVGMGKTFVALAVAASVALARPNDGPIVVMVPPSLKHKWPRDWAVFREHCLRGGAAVRLQADSAETGVGFLRLLDDPPDRQKSLIFLTHGALNRSLTDEWVKLALIRRALLRRSSMERERRVLPRFLGRLLRSQWIDRRAPGIWARLLDHPPADWRRILRGSGLEEAAKDDPVPAALIEAIEGLPLTPVLDALSQMPLRESVHVDEHLRKTREVLSQAMQRLWREWVRRTRFQSPLLVFDEAHHLKNVTRVTSLFIEEGAEEDSQAVSRGPLAGVFSRMLFLTATPFQLGHHELVNVMRRFEGITWDSSETPPIGRLGFVQTIIELERALTDAQLAALRLDRIWGRLKPEDLVDETGQSLIAAEWWRQLQARSPEAGLAAEVWTRYQQCHAAMRHAEQLLQPWVIRHLRPRRLPREGVAEAPPRRAVLVGAAIRRNEPLPGDPGLEVEGDSLFPFLMAARAQVVLASRYAVDSPKRWTFGEGLASSYEAYLETRGGKAAVDDLDEPTANGSSLDKEIAWYLDHLDMALPALDDEIRAGHPKVLASIDRALDLWWNGEKCLIFCHYRATGRALRRHISRLLEWQLLSRAAEALGLPSQEEARETLERLADQFFEAEGRLRNQAIQLLHEIASTYRALDPRARERVVDVTLRFLRTPSFLVRYLSLSEIDPVDALTRAFDRTDVSGLGIRRRIEDFCWFLAERCVLEERDEYLDALESIQTGTFRRDRLDPTDPTDDVRYLPNVRLANGQVETATRRRLLLAFNTPFFPEILIASSVLAEGVDLHLDCRFVVHHDLSWNPSDLEQRTGRLDRIGCKAERTRRPIHVYLPFVTATQDEKMFRVVRDRERWFSVVMGEKYQIDERTTDRLAERVPFPEKAARALALDLSAYKALEQDLDLEG
jgi:superfamily II DNA or RNA helicase